MLVTSGMFVGVAVLVVAAIFLRDSRRPDVSAEENDCTIPIRPATGRGGGT